MEKLTYAAVKAAARIAYAENRLQAQQPILWGGCHYRIGGEWSRLKGTCDNDKWGPDQPVLCCAIGAAVSDEFLIENPNLYGPALFGHEDWSDQFLSTEDFDLSQMLQCAHDRWATAARMGKGVAKEKFEELLFAD